MTRADRIAQARMARSATAIRERRMARWAMQREKRASRSVDEFHRLMALLDRGASTDELAEATAVLAVDPNDKQGSLL